jgi:hypothetical protein
MSEVESESLQDQLEELRAQLQDAEESAIRSLQNRDAAFKDMEALQSELRKVHREQGDKLLWTQEIEKWRNATRQANKKADLWKARYQMRLASERLRRAKDALE